jgi:hypothetical protein
VTRLAAVPARGRHRPGCPLPRRIENDPPSDNGFDHHEVPESAMTDIATNTPVEATRLRTAFSSRTPRPRR